LLVAEHPNHLSGWINLADAQASLGDLLDDTALLHDAEGTYRKVISDLIEGRADVGPLAKALLDYRNVSYILAPSSVADAIKRGADAKQMILANSKWLLGVTLSQLGKNSESADCLRQALSNPNHGRFARAMLQANLAGALNGAARYREAIEAYRASLELVPNAPKTLENLASLLAQCPDPQVRDPVEAVRLAKRAVELSPLDRDTWRVLAGAHYRAGDWPAAAVAIRRAMALVPDDPNDCLLLAKDQWHMGQKGEARNWYEKADAWIERNKPKHEGLRRSRAEAAALLGIAAPKKIGTQ
jgi:tetratricopeptide (TPR) repeat protein